MDYQRGNTSGQSYNLINPPGREVLSVQLNDYQGGHPRTLRNDRNVNENQFITEQISNDQNHVQRHADLHLKMRNPLFHEFHYKKVVEPQYTAPLHKQELAQVNQQLQSSIHADSLDMFQQNQQARQNLLDRAKWGSNLMNYDLTLQKQNDQIMNKINTPQQYNVPSISYPTKTPQSQQYQGQNQIRSNAPNIHQNPPQELQQQQYQQYPSLQNLGPPSRQQYVGSRQIKSYANLPKSPSLIQFQEDNYAKDDNFQNNNPYNNYQQQQQQPYNNQMRNNYGNMNNQNNLKDFDNPSYQQKLQQQERQLFQAQQQQPQANDVYQNQRYNQIDQNNYPQMQQQQNNNSYQQYQQPYSQAPQNNFDNEQSPDLINDKRMRKIYNPLVQKVSAVYEPRYGVNAVWDKYERDQFRNWQNKDQHYQNIVRSKNYIQDQYADYSTGNHEYGTKKMY